MDNNKNILAVVVVSECRLYGDNDGNFYTREGYDHNFWKRYVNVFDSIIVCARVGYGNGLKGYKKVNGKSVIVNSLPYYLGPVQFLCKFHKVVISLWRILNNRHALILRAPSVLSFISSIISVYFLRKTYAVELVGDASNIFTSMSSDHKLRSFFSVMFKISTKFIIKNATHVSYVTRNVLQNSFPANSNIKSYSYSSIQMLSDDYLSRDTYVLRRQNRIQLITICSMEVTYKRVDMCIDALRITVDAGYDAYLCVIGDGRMRKQYQALSVDLKIDHRVEFAGHITEKSKIHQRLDSSDIFLLCSSSEGLPRALIEAMARSLPSICTCVGGIQELLAERWMTPVGASDVISSKVIELANNEDLRCETGNNNYKKALEYKEEVIRTERELFYKEILSSLRFDGLAKSPSGRIY